MAPKLFTHILAVGVEVNAPRGRQGVEVREEASAATRVNGL